MDYEIREENGFRYKVIGELDNNGETEYFDRENNIEKRCRGAGVNEPCYHFNKGKENEYPTKSRPCEMNGNIKKDCIHLAYGGGSIKDFYITKDEWEKWKNRTEEKVEQKNEKFEFKINWDEEEK